MAVKVDISNKTSPPSSSPAAATSISKDGAVTNYDDLLEHHVGSMGHFQRCVICVFVVFSLIDVETIALVFVCGSMSHWCSVSRLANLSYDRQLCIAVPTAVDVAGYHADGQQVSGPSPSHCDDSHEPSTTAGDGVSTRSYYSSCLMFDLDYDALSDEQLESWNRSAMITANVSVVACNAWVYKQDNFLSTSVKRFNLVCGRENLVQLAKVFLIAGSIIGSLLAGGLSDRIGRSWTLQLSIACRVLGLIAVSTSFDSFVTSIFGRFLMGVGSGGCRVASYVLVSELVSARYRSVSVGCFQLAVSSGYALQAGIAYLVRDDVYYQIAATGPVVIGVAFFFFIPESPRWLLMKGKTREAEKTLQYICAVNGTQLPEKFNVSDISTANAEKTDWVSNMNALIRSRNMVVRTLVVSFMWPTNATDQLIANYKNRDKRLTSTLVYWALLFDMESLAGNIYVNTAVSSALELPAIFITNSLIDRQLMGRKRTVLLALLLSGLSCLICIPLGLFEYNTAVTVLSIIGKSSAVSAHVVFLVYAVELFPTEVRSVAFGVAYAASRVGSLVAPYMGSTMRQVWLPLPLVVFGVTSTLSGLLAVILPETLGRPLMNTISETQSNWVHDDKKAATADIYVVQVTNLETSDIPPCAEADQSNAALRNSPTTSIAETATTCDVMNVLPYDTGVDTTCL